MGVGVTEHYAGGFGEHHAFSISQALLAEADALGREGHVRILGDEFGVDHHAATLHAAEVKHLGMMHIESAKLGHDGVEIDAPHGAGLRGAYRAADVEAAEILNKRRAGDEHLAGRPRAARKCLAAREIRSSSVSEPEL